MVGMALLQNFLFIALFVWADVIRVCACPSGVYGFAAPALYVSICCMCNTHNCCKTRYDHGTHLFALLQHCMFDPSVLMRIGSMLARRWDVGLIHVMNYVYQRRMCMLAKLA